MITVEINSDAITRALSRAFDTLSDTTPIMQDIGSYLRSSTVDRFKSGVGPDGSAWAPNSPVTLARKKDTRPLFGESNRLNNEFGLEAGSDYAEVSSVLPYAAVQQFGAAQGQFGALMGRTQKTDKVKSHDFLMLMPWGNIPARPFFGISAEDEANILDTISEALGAALTP